MLYFHEMRSSCGDRSNKKRAAFKRRPKSTGRRHKDWNRDSNLRQPIKGYN